jgi:hypothetical protein
MIVALNRPARHSIGLAAGRRTLVFWQRGTCLLRDLVLWPVRVVRVQNELALFAQMSERDLQDIGLTSQDVRNATALPIDENPRRNRVAGSGPNRVGAP